MVNVCECKGCDWDAVDGSDLCVVCVERGCEVA